MCGAAGLCRAVAGARLETVQKAAQLLANMHEPHPTSGHTPAAVWRAAEACLGDLRGRAKAAAEGGDEWAEEVLRDLQAAARALPRSSGRDEL